MQKFYFAGLMQCTKVKQIIYIAGINFNSLLNEVCRTLAIKTQDVELRVKDTLFFSTTILRYNVSKIINNVYKLIYVEVDTQD